MVARAAKRYARQLKSRACGQKQKIAHFKVKFQVANNNGMSTFRPSPPRTMIMEPSDHQQYEQHNRHLIHEEPIYARSNGRGNNHLVATPSSSKTNDENLLTNGSRSSSTPINGEVRFNTMYGDPRER